jgi:hypothetical protein
MKHIYSLLVLVFCLILGFIWGYLINNKDLGNNSTFETWQESSEAVLDVNVDSNIVLDAQIQEVLNTQSSEGWNTISLKIETAFDNIKEALKNSSISDQHLSYYGVGNSLLFPIIQSAEECDSYLTWITTPSPDRFLNECLFQFYLKKLLENKWNYEVPGAILTGYSILGSIARQECSMWNDFQCMLIFGENITREQFLLYGSQAMVERWFTPESFLDSISIVSYGSYVFNDNINKIDTLDEALNLYYDEALIQKAIYEDEISYCEQINYAPSKKFCSDIIDGSNAQEYADLFSQFYSISE